VRSHLGRCAVRAVLFAATFAVGAVRSNELSIGFGGDHAVLFESKGKGNTGQIELSANFDKLVQLNTDQVFFNFVGSEEFLNPNGPISVNGDYGRTLGGNSHDVRTGDNTKHAPHATPEPATLTLLGTGMLALGTVARRRRKLVT